MENTPRSGMRRARRLIKPPTAEKPGKRRRQSEPNLTRKKNARRRSTPDSKFVPKERNMVCRAKYAIKRPLWSLAAAAILVAGSAVLYAAPRAKQAANAQEKEAATRDSGQGTATTLNDQTDLSVTVYNSNIALVRDVRNLTVPNGLFRLKLMDIAATVNPATVHFRSLNEPDKLSVIEQNYEYDLLEPAKL